MSESITLSQIEEHFDFLNYMYDSFRIVDPEYKKVLVYHKNLLKETDEVCYNCWGKNQICENCISVNAYHQNKALIKLMTDSDSITMVTALPVKNSDRALVLELLKDVTESLIFDSENNLDSRRILNSALMLGDMVVKDHLTGLYNRRFIDDRLPVDIINANLQKLPLSVIFIDVDDFKHINDTYGHEIGDLVLKATADAIRSCVRTDNDWAARYGGDEFFICLNNTDADTARVVAERMLGKIGHISIPVKDDNIHITVSVGIHTMLKFARTATEIIKLADQNMYESKHSGKNRITCRDEIE